MVGEYRVLKLKPQRKKCKPDIVAHTNSSALEAEKCRSEIKSLVYRASSRTPRASYTEKPYLKNNNSKKQVKTNKEQKK